MDITNLFQARNETQNNHIIDRLSHVHSVALRLAREGHTIEKIEIEGNRPLIWIQDTKQCRRLQGAWYKRDNCLAGQRYTHQADVDGCRVQWITTYHPPKGDEAC